MNAQERINQTDAIIAWLWSKRSTADDPRLLSSITKREIAVSYLLSARDEITKENYDHARADPQDAFGKANESYNELLFVQQNPPQIIVDPPPPVRTRIKTMLILSGIVAIVLVIAGICWWRRQERSWLE